MCCCKREQDSTVFVHATDQHEIQMKLNTIIVYCKKNMFPHNNIVNRDILARQYRNIKFGDSHLFLYYTEVNIDCLVDRLNTFLRHLYSQGYLFFSSQHL